MYEITLELITVIFLFCQGYLLNHFYSGFMKHRFSEKRAGSYYIIPCYILLRELLSILWHTELRPVESVLKQIVFFILLYIITGIFYVAEERMFLFLTVTFMATSEICMMFCVELIHIGSFIFDLWAWLVGRGILKIDDNTISMFKGMSLTIIGITYTLSLVILRTILRLVGKLYHEKEYRLQRKELIFLIAPEFTGWLMGQLLRVIVYTTDRDDSGVIVSRSMYERYPILLLLVPVILMIILIGIVSSIAIFQRLIVLNFEKSQAVLLEKQIGEMQAHVEKIERMNSDVRSMKHDMKNKLEVISGLASDIEGHDELKEYLKQMGMQLKEFELPFSTGNSVVDVLLSVKYHEAVEKMPKLIFDAAQLVFPAKLYIQGYDIGIILGNALDNAIEACEKINVKSQEHVLSNENTNQYIKVASLYDFNENMLFMEIENSCIGKLHMSPNHYFPVTDKKDKKEHGIGLSNISKMADKYHGGVDYQMKENIFTLTVMLKNAQTNVQRSKYKTKDTEHKEKAEDIGN